MEKRLGFRGWFYFRQGWSTYFAFLFAAINTLTVTYYLAIESYPVLKEVFPTFLQYVLIISVIGVPLLIGVGYFHYKKTPSFRAEADVFFESNPYWGRVTANSEIMVQINLKLLDILQKQIQNKLKVEDISKSEELIKEIKTLIDNRTIENKIDYQIFRKLDNLRDKN